MIFDYHPPKLFFVDKSTPCARRHLNYGLMVQFYSFDNGVDILETHSHCDPTEA